MCDEYGDEPVTLQDHDERRARKEHKCDACGETIRKGDRYNRTAYLFDGEWDSWKHCLRCYAICDALWSAGAEAIDMGLNCGETWEDPPPHVAKLAFMTADDAQRELKS